VQRHIEGNNLVLLAKILEGKQVVTLVAVNYEQHIATYPSPLYLLNKVL
jgi:hypothetical protein